MTRRMPQASQALNDPQRRDAEQHMLLSNIAVCLLRSPLLSYAELSEEPQGVASMFGEHDGERVCEAGLRRGVRSRPR